MPAPDDPERSMQFGHLLSEIEIGAKKLLDGAEEDVLLATWKLREKASEAHIIAVEVSREALDKIGGSS